MKSSSLATSATSAKKPPTTTPPTTTTGERLFGTYSPPVVPPFRPHNGTYASFAAIASGTGTGARALVATKTPIMKQSGTEGTTAIPFRATLYEDRNGTIQDLQAITAMEPYQESSFEELRIEDYAVVATGNNRRGAIASGSGRADARSSSSESNATATTNTGAISGLGVRVQNIDLSSSRASPSRPSQASATPIVSSEGTSTQKYSSPSKGFGVVAPSSSASSTLTTATESPSLSSSISSQVTSPYKFGITATDLSSGGVLGSLSEPVAQSSRNSPFRVRASGGAKKNSASKGPAKNNDSSGTDVLKAVTTPRRQQRRSKAPGTTPGRKCVTWMDQFTPNRKPCGLFRLTPEEKAELHASRPDLNRPPEMWISSDSVDEDDADEEQRDDTCDDINPNAGVFSASDPTSTPSPSSPSKGKLSSPNNFVADDSANASASSKDSHEHMPKVNKSGKSTSRRSKSCQKQKRSKQLVDCNSRASSSSHKAPKENNSPNIKVSSGTSKSASKRKNKAQKQQPGAGSSTPPRRRSDRIAARLRSENKLGPRVDPTET